MDIIDGYGAHNWMTVKNLKMKTKTLYHYCKLSTAIDFILPKRQLLLNLIGKTNDPRENKSFVFAASGMKVPDMATLQDHNSEVSRKIRNGCKLLCLSADEGYYFGYELSRMWAMYADNHKGVCIGLDREKFIDENRDKIEPNRFKRVKYVHLDIKQAVHHRQIDYDRIEEIGSADYINHFRKENLDYLFFTKNAEWESEQEVRLIHFSEMEGNEYCSIEKSLKAIYLGVDFDESCLHSIQTLCKGLDVFRLEYGDARLTNRLVR